ncbi:ribulose-phosphate 3-epimerase [Candidatus Gracilibacteria bacterium]|nr:ribulose-phosphate 3-epimerase [Candidatus Gracilibacteria bacterium]
MNTINISPSVLALKDNPESWDNRILELPIALSGVHFDIGDGEFVPSLMLSPDDLSYLNSELPVDVHLMVKRPSEYFEKILSFPSVQAVAFHIECDEDIHETIQTLKNSGKKVGLAILDTTPADHLAPYILEIDYVLVMTVKGGYSGTPFIPEVLPKISEIHNKRPELPIIVDGGIGESTLPFCLEAGATGAVMSSALFSGKSLDWLKEYVSSEG